jgi:chromate transporter
VFTAALRLGLTAFGGPVAHLGYFREEYVVRRRWLDDEGFSELVGLCQFLPGPGSSQLGFAVGWLRAGALGAVLAWIAFTLPAALLMFSFALAARTYHGPIVDGALHGLKLAAVAIVAQAVVGMARTLTPDARRLAIAGAAAGMMLLMVGPAVQVVVIIMGGVAGLIACKPGDAPRQHKD